MTDELLAYLLDDLSPERRNAVEQRLATDFAWQRELSRLQDCLAANGDPSKCAEETLVDPPSDLVQKTCHLVEHSDDLPPPSGKRRSAAMLTSAFTDAPCPAAGAKSWSLTDFAIGGGVLLLVGALVTPALFESRDVARRSVCQSNLQQLGAAIFNYQDARGHQLPPVAPGESAGVYAIALLEHGGLSREQLTQLLLCPESQLADDVAAGRVVMYIPNRHEYEEAVGPARVQMVKTMGGSYAYRIGFVVNRRLQQPQYTGEQGVPVMADAPALSPAGVRSANHPRGHNVLYECLSVGFRTDCVLKSPRDNFYLNALNQPAAGRNRKDIVLVASPIGPNGPLISIDE